MDEVSVGRPKVLFLDDDPDRSVSFLAEYPGAVWVRTAEECIARLSKPWDEVHLDHDLEGEIFVDHERDDCGMAVVRWLSAQARPDLKKTRFFVHTHNVNAACLIELHLEMMGYEVLVRPFGAALAQPVRHGGLRSLAERAIQWLSGGGDRRMAPKVNRYRVAPWEGHEPNEIKPDGL